MVRKLFPIVLAVVGVVAGLGAGLFLRPPASEAESSEPVEYSEAQAATGDDTEALHEYVKLNNQFVVPVVERGRVAALVVLSLSLEVTPGLTEKVYEMEPKLRDGLLQVMFDHANSGGFAGSFTDGANLVVLRQALRETAGRIFGKDVSDVLIVDIVRQDS